MNHDGDGMRPLTLGQSQLTKLHRVFSVLNSTVGGIQRLVLIFSSYSLAHGRAARAHAAKAGR